VYLAQDDIDDLINAILNREYLAWNPEERTIDDDYLHAGMEARSKYIQAIDFRNNPHTSYIE
jgi:hypothetical protein